MNNNFKIKKEDENKRLDLNIIAETDGYVVINKPCGLIVHPSIHPHLQKSAVPARLLACPLNWQTELAGCFGGRASGAEESFLANSRDSSTRPPQNFCGGLGRNDSTELLDRLVKEGFTLVDILLKRYPDIAGVGESPERPGIVHRLDKEVSGIMIIAKTEEMFAHLKKQFQERTVKKEYIALVYGKVSQPNGVINFPIARSEKNGVKMAARSVNQGGREAITEFTVLKYLARWTLLSVKIKTGRTHQIRVHLNAYGHPVVGDKIYKPKKLKPCVKFGDRLFLHAWHLGFTDLAGEWKEFEAELPAEFARIMAD